MDPDKMTQAMELFLEGLGIAAADFEGGDLARTPRRVAQAWCDDLVSGAALDPEAILTWTAIVSQPGPVLVREISFASVCAHHLLPFSGRAQVAYQPAVRLAGLSKIGRVVDAHARRLQTQEHLTASIAETLDRVLEPHAVLVVVEAEHSCMTLRGVRKEQARMVTMEARGLYRAEPARRSEILSLLRPGAA